MEPLCLPGHHNKICDALYESFKSVTSLCDVAVTTSDHVTFKTHRVILTTFSQYFVLQFQNKRKTGTLSVDVDSKSLQCLLEFMYTGVLSVTDGNRLSLYQAAVSLNMPDVQELLLQNVTTSLSKFSQPGLSLFTESSKHEGNTCIKIKQEVELCTASTSQSASGSHDNMFQETLTSAHHESDDNHLSDHSIYDSVSDFTPRKSKRSKSSSKKTKSISKKRATSTKRKGRKTKSSSKGSKPKSCQILKTTCTPRKNDQSRKKENIKRRTVSQKLKCHCGVCGTSYTTYTMLKRHMFIKHNSVTPDFYQNRLLMKWYLNQTRNQHFKSSTEVKVESDSPQQTEENCCKKCGKSFKTYCLLCAHVMKKHAAVFKTIRRDMYHARIAYILAKKKFFTSRAKQRIQTSKNKTKTRKEKVNCVLCDAEISCLRHLTSHMIKVHGFSNAMARNVTGYPQNSYRIPSHCPDCNISFPTRKELSMHLRNHHKTVAKPEDLACSECSVKCKSVLALKTHLKNVHKKSYTGIRESMGQAVPCEVEGCDFSSANLSVLNKHVMSSHPEVEYKCSECGYTFHIKSQRDKHFLFKHKNRDENQRHQCSVCEKKFSKPYYLQKHQFMVHGIDHPNIKRYRCEVEGCDYVSVYTTGLAQHMHSKHSNKEKNFQCDHCGMKLRSKITLKKHINKIHLNIRPHMCHICGMKFGEEPELMAHITNRHTEEKQFQCEYCSYQTSNKCTFKTHLFLIHKVRAQNEKRPEFRCPHCDFVTVLPGRFRVHVNVHNNIRDYACKFCEKKFFSSGTLREHIQWNHSQTTHACGYCDYTTKTKKKLNEHIRVQHQLKGLKAYSCPYCEFTCATGGNCRKHVMLKHKGQEVRYHRDDNLLMAARIARESGTSVTSLIAQATEAVSQVIPEVPDLQYPSYNQFSQYTGQM